MVEEKNTKLFEKSQSTSIMHKVGKTSKETETSKAGLRKPVGMAETTTVIDEILIHSLSYYFCN